jgi:hypothetical protein
VGQHRIVLFLEALGLAEAPLSEFAERGAGLHQLQVRMHFLEGPGIELALLVAGLARAGEVGAGDVGAVAEGPDHVGVEADQLVRADLAARGLLLPGVGAVARGE